MDSAKKQLADKLKSSNNVLVTVSNNPSVDQLAALLGLSLLLNKQGKHCAAVFSGEIPSTIEFLKPEDTIEKNTDSLRDFIIALDKSKADKLRYKVEDNVVRIFITPYRSSITQDDLEFSQGDFNVDSVVAIGVRDQNELDQSITAHGRILHDATVATINISGDNNGLGSINWSEPSASSLSELVAELAQAMGDDSFDEQIATALLTGIVAETNRFSNEKTSSQTMSISAALMSAGANQQLIATQLEEPADGPKQIDESGDDQGSSEDNKPAKEDGTLEIDHESGTGPPDESSAGQDIPPMELPTPEEDQAESEESNSDADHNDAPANDQPAGELPAEQGQQDMPPAGLNLSPGSRLITEPPTLGGDLTANTSPNEIDPVTDPFSMPQTEQPQLLQRPNGIPEITPLPPPTDDLTPVPAPPPVPADLTPPPPAWTPPPPPVQDTTINPLPPQDDAGSQPPQVHIDEEGTLSQLEQAVNSPHLATPDVDSAREEINKALNAAAPSSEQPPIEALNAQQLGPDLHPSDMTAPLPPAMQTDNAAAAPAAGDPSTTTDQTLPQPPPVPPPIPFEFGNPPTQQ